MLMAHYFSVIFHPYDLHRPASNSFNFFHHHNKKRILLGCKIKEDRLIVIYKGVLQQVKFNDVLWYHKHMEALLCFLIF